MALTFFPMFFASSNTGCKAVAKPLRSQENYFGDRAHGPPYLKYCSLLLDDISGCFDPYYGWFIGGKSMKILSTWMFWGYPYFGKPPYWGTFLGFSSTFHGYVRSKPGVWSGSNQDQWFQLPILTWRRWHELATGAGKSSKNEPLNSNKKNSHVGTSGVTEHGKLGYFLPFGL